VTNLGEMARKAGLTIIAVPIAIAIVVVAVPLALLSGLITTWTGEGRRHDEAWAPMRGRNAEGLTAFQVLCERKLIETVEAAGANLSGRKVNPITHRGKPTDELCIEWSIEGTALRIGIYPDGGGIWGETIDDRLEEWDARTPDDLIEILCAYAVRRATEFRPVV
jgi:hypothetical protein